MEQNNQTEFGSILEEIKDLMENGKYKIEKTETENSEYIHSRSVRVGFPDKATVYLAVIRPKKPAQTVPLKAAPKGDIPA